MNESRRDFLKQITMGAGYVAAAGIGLTALVGCNGKPQVEPTKYLTAEEMAKMPYNVRLGEDIIRGLERMQHYEVPKNDAEWYSLNQYNNETIELIQRNKLLPEHLNKIALLGSPRIKCAVLRCANVSGATVVALSQESDIVAYSVCGAIERGICTQDELDQILGKGTSEAVTLMAKAAKKNGNYVGGQARKVERNINR